MTSLVAIGRLVTDRKAGLRSLVVKVQAGALPRCASGPGVGLGGIRPPPGVRGVSVFPSDLIVLAAIVSFFVPALPLD